MIENTNEIEEVALHLHHAPLPLGVERRWVTGGGSAEEQARVWVGYGWSADDVEGWLRVGIWEPSVAAELRAEGWGPTLWPFRDLEYVGMALGAALSDGHLLATDVRHLLEGQL